MSALGQKRTYAVQNDMSALPPIATAKADIESWQAITIFLISIQTHKEWRPCYRFQFAKQVGSKLYFR